MLLVLEWIWSSLHTIELNFIICTDFLMHLALIFQGKVEALVVILVQASAVREISYHHRSLRSCMKIIKVINVEEKSGLEKNRLIFLNALKEALNSQIQAIRDRPLKQCIHFQFLQQII